MRTHVYRSVQVSVTAEMERCPERASCPVCSREVAFTDINSHIDKCLRDEESCQQPPLTPGSGEADNAPAPPSRQRQSVLSGFRKREISSASTSSAPGKKRKLCFTTSPTAAPTTATTSAAASTAITTTSATSITTASAATVKSLSTPQRSSSRPTATTTTASLSRSTPQQSSSSQTATQSSSHHATSSKSLSHSLSAPLSDLVRPASLTDYMGQEEVLGHSSLLRTAIETGHTPSLIFWGPPGCGKTTLARILGHTARDKAGARYVQLSASCCGVGEVKETVRVARNDKLMLKRQTVLFIDEIHQFNKLQQDTFLPHVEDGTITLLGATTENPSFKLNSALLSRCKVIVLKKLEPQSVQTILRNALSRLVGSEQQVRGKGGGEGGREGGGEGEGGREGGGVVVEDDAVRLLSELCDGDARSALNALQMAVETAQNRQHTHHTGPEQALVTVSDAKESMQCSHLLYDRAGEEHYNCISALHKSMRGNDPTASLYWLARMLCAGEDPLYVARRIVRFASEDIGLAEPAALEQAVSAFHACHAIGMPECELALAQAVVYMARAPKSVEVYRAYSRAVATIRDHRGPQPTVPLHLRNAPTQLMKDLGYARDYQYNPDCQGPIHQNYMPDALLDAENSDSAGKKMGRAEI